MMKKITNNELKEIMKDAHGKYRQGIYECFAESLKHAWLEFYLDREIKEMMKGGKDYDRNYS